MASPSALLVTTVWHGRAIDNEVRGQGGNRPLLAGG